MNQIDLGYQNLVRDILENGHKKNDRTGTGTISVFGRTIRHNMKDGFPPNYNEVCEMYKQCKKLET